MLDIMSSDVQVCRYIVGKLVMQIQMTVEDGPCGGEIPNNTCNCHTAVHFVVIYYFILDSQASS